MRPAFLKNRFIPTCVGNIVVDGTTQTLLPVHPHVCGEHVAGDRRITMGTGSSPRVWGTLQTAIL